MFKRFTAGVAVGYVLGARAGQKRYDQISDLAERALDIPFVEHLADTGRTMARDQGRKVLAGIKDRAQWDASDDRENQAEDDDDTADFEDEGQVVDDADDWHGRSDDDGYDEE